MGIAVTYLFHHLLHLLRCSTWLNFGPMLLNS
jgi:hypothetical protein